MRVALPNRKARTPIRTRLRFRSPVRVTARGTTSSMDTPRARSDEDARSGPTGNQHDDRSRYGVVLTVILPSMISCLALSTAAMTSVILVKAGLDMARPTPSLSRP